MRRVLGDEVRARRAWKRGSGQADVSLAAIEGHDEEGRLPQRKGAVSLDDRLAFEEALAWLATWQPLGAHVVGLRCYEGLTIRETARTLSVSPASVKRGWAVATPCLRHRLSTNAAQHAAGRRPMV